MRIVPTVVLVLGLAAALQADNWPHWRGPSGSGVTAERGLPERWSDTDNVAWKAPLEGLGISSPIVWGDRIFVTSQRGSGVVQRGPRLMQSGNAADAGERPLGPGAQRGDGRVTFLVSVFDRATGTRAWRVDLAAEGPLPSVHDKHNLASPSPATDGQRVYAVFATGQVAARTRNALAGSTAPRPWPATARSTCSARTARRLWWPRAARRGSSRAIA